MEPTMHSTHLLRALLLLAGLFGLPSQGGATESPPGPSTATFELRLTGDAPDGAALEKSQETVEELEQRVSELESQIQALESHQEGEQPLPAHNTGFGNGVLVAEGETTEQAVSFGGPVIVNGKVLGDAVAFGGDVEVHATGSVQGNAVSFGGHVLVEPGATISGDRVAFSGNGASDEAAPVAGEKPAFTGSILPSLHWAGSWVRDQVRRLVVLLSLAGAGVLVMGLFPDRIRSVSSSLEHHPIRHSFAGGLLFFAATLAIVLFSLTIIGIPVAAAVVVVLAVAWLLGFVALCQTAGDLLPWPPRAHGRLAAFLAGIAILGTIGMVPYVGKVLLVLTLFPCLGAAIATRFGGKTAEAR
jgi:hypothetical protein